MAVERVHYRFTSAEYHRMAELGIIPEDARVELIDGEIMEMSPVGRRHKACVDRVSRFFNRQLGDSVIVRTQSSLVLGDGLEPEPNVALLRYREDFYAESDETPEDVLLLVEVADSSLEYDRRTKAPLYARHAIPELWIVDLNRERLLPFRDPTPLGYTTALELRLEETVSPLAFPELAVRVGTFFGK